MAVVYSRSGLQSGISNPFNVLPSAGQSTYSAPSNAGSSGTVISTPSGLKSGIPTPFNTPQFGSGQSTAPAPTTPAEYIAPGSWQPAPIPGTELELVESRKAVVAEAEKARVAAALMPKPIYLPQSYYYPPDEQRTVADYPKGRAEVTGGFGSASRITYHGYEPWIPPGQTGIYGEVTPSGDILVEDEKYLNPPAPNTYPPSYIEDYSKSNLMRGEPSFTEKLFSPIDNLMGTKTAPAASNLLESVGLGKANIKAGKLVSGAEMLLSNFNERVSTVMVKPYIPEDVILPRAKRALDTDPLSSFPLTYIPYQLTKGSLGAVGWGYEELRQRPVSFGLEVGSAYVGGLAFAGATKAATSYGLGLKAAALPRTKLIGEGVLKGVKGITWGATEMYAASVSSNLDLNYNEPFAAGGYLAKEGVLFGAFMKGAGSVPKGFAMGSQKFKVVSQADAADFAKAGIKEVEVREIPFYKTAGAEQRGSGLYDPARFRRDVIFTLGNSKTVAVNKLPADSDINLIGKRFTYLEEGLPGEVSKIARVQDKINISIPASALKEFKFIKGTEPQPDILYTSVLGTEKFVLPKAISTVPGKIDITRIVPLNWDARLKGGYLGYTYPSGSGIWLQEAAYRAGSTSFKQTLLSHEATHIRQGQGSEFLFELRNKLYSLHPLYDQRALEYLDVATQKTLLNHDLDLDLETYRNTKISNPRNWYKNSWVKNLLDRTLVRDFGAYSQNELPGELRARRVEVGLDKLPYERMVIYPHEVHLTETVANNIFNRIKASQMVSANMRNVPRLSESLPAKGTVFRNTVISFGKVRARMAEPVGVEVEQFVKPKGVKPARKLIITPEAMSSFTMPKPKAATTTKRARLGKSPAMPQARRQSGYNLDYVLKLPADERAVLQEAYPLVLVGYEAGTKVLSGNIFQTKPRVIESAVKSSSGIPAYESLHLTSAGIQKRELSRAQFTPTKQETRMSQVLKPDITTMTGVRGEVVPRTEVIPRTQIKTETKVMPKVLTDLKLRTNTVLKTELKVTTKKPPIPPGYLTMIQRNPIKRARQPKPWGAVIRTKYTPSVEAILFNVRAQPSLRTRVAEVTGIDIRPILKRRF